MVDPSEVDETKRNIVNGIMDRKVPGPMTLTDLVKPVSAVPAGRVVRAVEELTGEQVIKPTHLGTGTLYNFDPAKAKENKYI